MYFLCEVISEDLTYEVGSLVAFNRMKYDQFWVSNHRSLKVVEKQMGKSLHVWQEKYNPIWLDNEFTEETKEEEVIKNEGSTTEESPTAEQQDPIGVEIHEVSEEVGQDSSSEDGQEVLDEVIEEPVEEEITDKDVIAPSASEEVIEPKVEKEEIVKEEKPQPQE